MGFDRFLPSFGERTVCEARYLRQPYAPVRRFLPHASQQAAPTKLLRHPALEKRLGAHPEVEVGVEVAPEAFDVEQRFLQ